MKKKTDSILARLVAIAIFIAVIAGTWDTWWHGVIGRDTFWEPPHILLYSATVIAIALGLYGWRETRKAAWRNLAIILLIVPLSAPFDELWHRAFGEETITSPLIIWSPPHIALVLAIIASLLFILPLIRKDKDVIARRIFSAGIFASILSLLFFLASPLEPTGPWALFGFWGAGVGALFLVSMLLISRQWLRGFAPATLVIIFFILLAAVSSGQEESENVIVNPHDHAPSWLMVFSLIIPALFIDIQKKLPLWLVGAIAGTVWAGLLYTFSTVFFEPQFTYGTLAIVIAVFASLIAGALAGLVLSTIKFKKLSG